MEEEDSENVEDAQSETNTERNEAERPRDHLEEIMEQILDGAAERVRTSMDIDDEVLPLGYDPDNPTVLIKFFEIVVFQPIARGGILI